MMKMQKLAAAAAAMMVAGSVWASPVVLPEGSMGTVGAAPSLFGGVLATGAPTASFSDNFYFDLAEFSDLTGSLGTFAGSVTFSSVKINDWSVALSPTQSFSVLGLAAGSYTLSVEGFVPTGVNAYSGAVYATPAIPEAGSVAMVLAGLGMVGMLSVRRRRH